MTGLTVVKPTERVKKRGRVLRRLVGPKWGSGGMHPGELDIFSNTFIRSKHQYGLKNMGAGETILKEDRKWEGATMEALLRRRFPLLGKGRRNIQALL